MSLRVVGGGVTSRWQVVKMDIESYEYRTLRAMLDDGSIHLIDEYVN
jgi:hypothetical protein